MSTVLQKLVRQELIGTTMGYYVDLDADELAEDLCRSHKEGKAGREDTVLGPVDDSQLDSVARKTTQPLIRKGVA
jgi:hypothetical protein